MYLPFSDDMPATPTKSPSPTLLPTLEGDDYSDEGTDTETDSEKETHSEEQTHSGEEADIEDTDTGKNPGAMEFVMKLYEETINNNILPFIYIVSEEGPAKGQKY